VIADYRLSTPRLADPYQYYRLLRDHDPAHYSGEEDLWVISRFEDCLEVFSDWKRWSSERRGNLLNDPPERIGRTLGTTDPPRHTTARQLVNKAFTPRRVADLEPVIRDHARRLSAAASAVGRVEYVHDVAAPLTANVLGALFGLSESGVLELRPALDDFFTRETATSGVAPPHVAAMELLRQALDDLVEARHRHPGPDLVSAMIAAEEEGARLSHEQVVVTTMTFLTAGFESVNNLLTNVANVLATIPGVFAAVRGEPELVPQLVEETMRWDAAAQGFVRTPTEDVVLHGRTIPAGAQVLVHIGSANRDERQFTDPDRFDLARPMKRHLGLGHGTHFCIGAPLGRQLARISVEELLPVSECFEADYTTAERVKTPNFRGFMRLDVNLRA
jgi:cytochrome P450 family 130